MAAAAAIGGVSELTENTRFSTKFKPLR